MGCDIHCYAERRVNNQWEKVGDHFEYSERDKTYYEKDKGDRPFFNRDYDLFAFLAGVRGYLFPIHPPKGIPEDVSQEVLSEFKSWGVDAHTPSFLTLKELLDYNYSDGVRETLGNDFFIVLDELKELGSPEDVRIVFWFDN